MEKIFAKNLTKKIFAKSEDEEKQGSNFLLLAPPVARGIFAKEASFSRSLKGFSVLETISFCAFKGSKLP
jgi:hypothetical protein